jgi:predicted phage terminase large subunit-like protein
MGEVFVVWDWALSNQKTSDYSAGVVARKYQNDQGEWSYVILEIIFDKWKYSELSHQIVSLSKRWGPKMTVIEKSNGADMLRDEITRVGRRFGYDPYIYWKHPSQEENAKRNRIKSLEMLMSEHRLHFVLGPWMDETIKQLTQYTGEKKNKGRKDDIPDALSYLTYLLPMSARPKVVNGADPEEERRLQEEQDRQFNKQRNYERIFGSNLLTNTQTGPVLEQPQPEKTPDPRLKVFGFRGPWRL